MKTLVMTRLLWTPNHCTNANAALCPCRLSANLQLLHKLLHKSWNWKYFINEIPSPSNHLTKQNDKWCLSFQIFRISHYIRMRWNVVATSRVRPPALQQWIWTSSLGAGCIKMQFIIKRTSVNSVNLKDFCNLFLQVILKYFRKSGRFHFKM